MKTIECTCQKCGIDYIYNVMELCSNCTATEIKKIFAKQKKSKWYIFKNFSWFALLVMPISFYLGAKDGFKMQWFFNFALLYGMVIDPLSDWLTERF